MKSALRIVLPLAVSAFFLWLVLKGFNLSDLKDALARAQWGYVCLALLTYPMGFLFRGFRWKVLLSKLASPPAGKVFSVLTFGFLVNNILPARAGEFARAYAGGKEFGIPVASCLGTIAIERLTDLASLLVFLLVSFTVVKGGELPVEKVLLLVSVGAVGALIGFLLIKKKIIKKISASANPIVKKMLTVLSQFLEGFSVVGSFSLLIKAFFLGLLVWTMETLTIYLIATGFGLDIDPIMATVVLVGCAMGAMIPAAPGYIGTFEFFAQRAMGFLGITGPIVTSFVLFLHFFQFTLSSLLGFPYMIKIGFIPKKEKES